MRPSAIVTWTLSAFVLLTAVVPAQENPATRLQREQNEILRKSERLKELMTRLRDRYERDGRADQVRLLEAGLEHLERSRLLTAAAAVPGNLDNGAYDDALREQATVIAELEKLLDILLERQSIENLDEEIERTEEMLAQVGELIERQNELQQGARDARDDTTRQSERELLDALDQLARDQRGEAAENERQAGTHLPVLESAMARLRALLESQQVLEEGTERQLGGAPDESRETAFELGAIEQEQRDLMGARGRERELEKLADAARELEAAAEASDADRMRDAHDRLSARVESAARDGEIDAELRQNLEADAERLSGTQTNTTDAAKQALIETARGIRDRAERAKDAARAANDASQNELEERSRAAAENTRAERDGERKPTAASRALESAADSMRDAREQSRSGNSAESLSSTSSALRKLAEARQRFRDANPSPSTRARDMAASSDQVARDLRAAPAAGDDEEEAAEALDEAQRALRAASEQLGRDESGEERADPAATREQLDASRTGLERALEALSEAFENATGDRSEAARAAAQRQADLAQRAAEMRERIERAEANGELTPEQAKAGQQAMQRAESAMQRASSALEQGRQSSASDQQTRAADELERAAEGIERNRPLTEQERQELQRIADEQEKLEEDIIRLAKLAEERQNKRAADALQRAASSSQRASRALDDGDPEEAEQQQQDTRQQLEQAQEALEEERDRYLDLRQEELLFRIAEELKQFLETQRGLTEQTEQAGMGLAQGGRLSRPVRRKLNQVAESERELIARTEFILQALVEEGVLVFSHALRANIDDLREVAGRLSGRSPDPGSFTVMLQRDVEERAVKLLEALKREQQRRQQQQQNQGQNQFGNQKQPLVPLIAELKMLRQMEEDLRVRTQQVERLIQAAGADGISEFDITMAERLGHQHAALSELFKKIKTGIEQAMQQGEQQDPFGEGENKDKEEGR